MKSRIGFVGGPMDRKFKFVQLHNDCNVIRLAPMYKADTVATAGAYLRDRYSDGIVFFKWRDPSEIAGLAGNQPAAPKAAPDLLMTWNSHTGELSV
jgi:hypothetical protein